MSETLINGPVNVARLEGKIGSVPKVIYLFMDRHDSVVHQTECTDIFAKDVNTYFVDTFKEIKGSDTTYDFFMETNLGESKESQSDSFFQLRERYIDDMIRLFTGLFRFDNDSNKIKINEVFENVRLHYLDIRDHLQVTIRDEYQLDNVLGRINPRNLKLRDLKLVSFELKSIRDNLQKLLDLFSKPIGSNNTVIDDSNIPYNLDPKIVSYFVRKMEDQYHHQDVKKILNDALQKLLSMGKEIMAHINQLIAKYDSLVKEKTLLPSHILFDETYPIIDEGLINFYARLTDIFMLRRFLDKDYITNAITYSGIAHSSYYINVLVNRFGFKLTHLANKTGSLALTLKDIKAGNKGTSIFMQQGQCSDMTSFPKHFL